MRIGREELLRLYRTMLTIRRFDERASKEVRAGAIPGLVHAYIGQEAVATGVCANLQPDDRIVSNHRGHGHCIAKGADVRRMMAEIFGRKTGYCKGKGGSMHIADFSIGMLGANGIVGGGLPIAVGAAMAAQLLGGGRVVVAFFGDGACQEGEFHEALNLASIWKLPLLFVCENNLYGVNTHVGYALGSEDIAKRSAPYGIPGAAADGNDVVAVYEAAREAIGRIRAEQGPAFLEFKTYRWGGHFESDAMVDLRPTAEIKAWKEKCPIASLERRLLETGMVTQQELAAIGSQVAQQIGDAVSYALASPLPQPEDALEDIFSD
ncbi:MAG: thiamine pyrophosphate-dependent dehydrogenase E1 component subunit alpha [Chloroflexi bacterium]|nr:thiamine pyrophosphate-dependent dehydrogenase E1 component subunit alpha [Chloroflexota bacterium]